MLKGTYEISTDELTDTSGSLVTPFLIGKNYAKQRFELKDFPGLFYSNSDVKGSGFELAQYQHLMYIWQSQETNHELRDSLKNKRFYTDSAVSRRGIKYFIGRAHVSENVDLSIDINRPHGEIAFSQGPVKKLSEDTLWKPISRSGVMKARTETNLNNINDRVLDRFVEVSFWSVDEREAASADAIFLPLEPLFMSPARLVKKIE